MNLFVFGSSLKSTYWNGAATYYRGIYKYLFRLGYRITFAEPDIYNRQKNQDQEQLDYAKVIVYRSSTEIPSLLQAAAKADIIIKHSGVGAEDESLERCITECRSKGAKAIYWDVDAPATLARIDADGSDPFRRLIPKYDAVLTYGGGAVVTWRYLKYGAKLCRPIYNGFDPETHYPVSREQKVICDLAFLGHRLPDRESRVEEFFFNAAAQSPDKNFILGGEGWGEKSMPNNVRWIGHVGSNKHNVINCSARMVLNVTRDSMASVGFSPPTRVFEAAGAGACVITDAWDGVETFFAPNTEILCAASGREVAHYLSTLTAEDAATIGDAMRQRALREHTYTLRAKEADTVFREIVSNRGTEGSAQLAANEDPATRIAA